MKLTRPKLAVPNSFRFVDSLRSYLPNTIIQPGTRWITYGESKIVLY
jgi:hypothetical protein